MKLVLPSESKESRADKLMQRVAEIRDVAFPSEVDPFALYVDRLEQLIRDLMWKCQLTMADGSLVWAPHRRMEPRFYFTVVTSMQLPVGDAQDAFVVTSMRLPEGELNMLEVTRRLEFYPHRELAEEVARLRGVFQQYREQLDAMARALVPAPRARRNRRS